MTEEPVIVSSYEDRQEQEPAAGLACPSCGCPQSKVWRTRRRVLTINGQKVGGIRRERICDHCGRKFVTNEAAR